MSPATAHALSPAAPNAVLSVQQLEVTFAAKKGPSVAAVKGATLDVLRGEVVGLAGPDGAGKTTLIRAAAGLLAPTGGRVTVLGLDSMRDALEIRERIGYMPQKFGLYQDLTVRENMDLYADLQGVPKGERRERYPRLLAMTGLAPFQGRLAGQLSGGMKQKLGLSCALIKSPELLLLDEPTVGVDPVSRRELWAIVYDLVREDGIGVLVSTAYLDEAERCDRALVMMGGEIVCDESPAQFRERVRGRCFEVTPSSQREARRLRNVLHRHPGVADTTIRSGRVRVVTTGRLDGVLSGEFLEELDVELRPVAPTFEDAFMGLVHERAYHESVTPVATPDDQRDASPTAGDATAEIVVRVRELRKRFGAFEAVKGVNFEVRRGEIFGLLGPNGAGKSTTFRMLCGLLTVSDGEVNVAGHDLRHAASRARGQLGYMAQQFSLYGSLSVVANLRFFGRAYGLRGKRLRDRIAWALSEFDLESRKDLAAGELPGGYKQRLAMAAALLHEPPILFLDEPTSGVDPLARREFWQRITDFAEGGVTVVVTTHFMEEAEYCDRMVIMVQGSPLFLGTPGEVRDLVRTEENPDPTIEDAFIALSKGEVAQDGGEALP